MNSARLPIELCEHTIDYAGDRGLNGLPAIRIWSTCDLVDYRTLLACTLVCRDWRPRARYNLFHRVSIRTARQLKLFLDVSKSAETAGCPYVQVREFELGLPLWIPTRGSADSAADNSLTSRGSEQESVVSPALARAVRGVAHLLLCRSEWLYPRTYIGVLSSHFASVTTLDLYRVVFPTGGDLARVLWSFPGLVTLRCAALIVKLGGTARRLPICPAPMRAGELCKNLSEVIINGCSSTAPFIMRAVTVGSARIAKLKMRSSFARWDPTDYQALSVFGDLSMLELVLASPTVYTPLPPRSSLIAVYREAMHAILYTIAAASSTAMNDTGSHGLQVIDITVEPGHGPWAYLCGENASEGGFNGPARYWTYEEKRSVALSMLFAGLEETLVDGSHDGGSLKRQFSNLQDIRIRIWDTQRGKADTWWSAAVSDVLPALHRLGLLRIGVVRLTQSMSSMPLWSSEETAGGSAMQ